MQGTDIIHYSEVGEDFASHENMKKILGGSKIPDDEHMLYEHQKAALLKLIQLCSTRVIFVDNPGNRGFGKITDTKLVCVSGAVRLDLPPGSGKTAIEINNKLMFKKPQKMIANSASTVIGYSWELFPHPQQRNGDEKHKMRKFEEFTSFRTNLKIKYPSSIAPGAYVCKPLTQVRSEFFRFAPTLKIFIIRDAHSLEQFAKFFRDKTINNYDVVIIKYSGVSVSFSLDGNQIPEAGKYYNMTDAVNIIMKGTAFPWVVYDDYDTVKLSHDAQVLNANFVDLVSGTNDERPYNEVKRDVKHKTLEEMIRSNTYANIWDIPRDRMTCNTFVAAVEKEFLKNSMQLPFYNQYLCVYKNPNDKLIGLMGVMGNADGIMEALNGDAIQTAAEMLNIATNSVADIFEKMLGNSYTAYLNDKFILSVLYAARDYYKAYQGVLPDHPKGRHSEKELSSLREKFEKVGLNETKRAAVLKIFNTKTPARLIVDEYGEILPDHKSKIIKHKSDQIFPEINMIINIYEKNKDDHGAAIRRVQENLRAGKCDICKFTISKKTNDSSESSSDIDSDFDDDIAGSEGIFIPKCCGIIVCEACFRDAFHVRQYHDYKSNTNKLMGKCANCPFKNINIATDVIYVNPEFDVHNIISGFGDETAPPEEPEEPEEPDAEAPPEIKIDNPKLKAIWQIYNGYKPDNMQKIKEKMFYYPETEDRPAHWKIDPGTHEAKSPPGKPIKILCFAPFTETLMLIMDFCQEHKMNCVSLKGNDLQINKIITDAQNSTENIIVLVNSEVNCASLNMQRMTDMIEMCDIKDNHKKIQMRGRLQRIGREYEANYWILRYTNESGLPTNGADIV